MFFEFSDNQDSNAEHKIDKITNQNVFKTEKLFIETLTEVIKPVVMGEQER